MRLRRNEVIAALQEELRISEKGKKTGILQIALDGPDAGRVAAILDAIAQTYLRQNVERKSAEAEKTLDFLSAQLPNVKANLEAAEAELERYRTKAGSNDISLETKATLDHAIDVERAAQELQIQEAELAQRFTESHPIRAALREKLARVKTEKSAIDARLKNLPANELEQVRRMRDVKVTGDVYVLLLNKAEELRIVKSGTIGYVRIIDRAFLPDKPVSPKKALSLAVSAVLGLALSIGVAWVRESLSRGMAAPDAIERETGLPVFAAVPHSAHEERSVRGTRKRGALPVLATTNPDDVAVESIRSLRTSLHFALAQAPNRIIGVLGPSPGIGKTFCAINLAHVLAESGKRVVVVDTDLRRGRLHQYSDGVRAPGLSEAIAGIASLEEVARASGRGVDIITSGEMAPNASALRGSASFAGIVADLGRRYDYVVLDTAPVLAVTDATLVATLSSVNLLVLGAGQHVAREIMFALRRLEQGGARVHGAVLNNMTSSSSARHYYYYSHPDGSSPA